MRGIPVPHLRWSGIPAGAVTSLLAASGLVLALGQPADAQTAYFPDPHGDVSVPADIYGVKATNPPEGPVLIKIRLHAVEEVSTNEVWIDTSRHASNGPDYRIGVVWGGDFPVDLRRVHSWHDAGTAVHCPRANVEVVHGATHDTTTFSFPRRCVERAPRVRVAVRTEQSDETDWAPRRHRFFGWIRAVGSRG